MTEIQADRWLVIGTIVAAHGIQGEIKVLSESDFPERFTNKGKRWLRELSTSQPRPILLKKGRQVPGKNVFVVRLEGIENRNQAEALVSQQLLVSPDNKPTLATDEYYVSDLIGKAVHDKKTQEQIGTVTDFYAVGNDLLAITLTTNPEKTVLVPFVAAIVTGVDLQNNCIELDPPPGLLDP